MILSNLLVASTAALQQIAQGDNQAPVFAQIPEITVLQRIAFGSCYDQIMPKLTIPMLGIGKDIWTVIRGCNPQVMIFLGDNVYARTTNLNELRAAYDQLEADASFVGFRRNVPILATWDDNDYGYSDAGAEHPTKAKSQAVFLDFFGVPRSSPRWSREGIYDAAIYGKPGARTQIILLDTRYFRDALVKRSPSEPKPPIDRTGPYVPTTDTTATILGETQWKWLEEQLRKPAELRLVASSIQVVSEEHGYEKWANFPHERERLFRLIRETNAKNVIIISGDRHHAEISRLDEAVGYPLFDVTSSSLNKPRMFTIEANRHRVGDMYFQSNFGLISIDWGAAPPTVLLEIRNANALPVLSQEMTLSH